MGERLHKVLGKTDLGTLDSGERLLPFGLLVMNYKPILDFFISTRSFLFPLGAISQFFFVVAHENTRLSIGRYM